MATINFSSKSSPWIYRLTSTSSTRVAAGVLRDSAATWSDTGEVLHDQTHRELVYRPLQFNKRSQLVIGVHNEAVSVIAMSVNNPNRPPFKIQHLGNSPSFMTDSALMRLASSCSVRLVLTLKGASKCQNT